LGYHSLFGFLESFSANKFCRLCETTKADAQTKFIESEFKLRTVASYESAVARLSLPGYSASETGIRADCALNKLRYFHVTQNFAVDAMHDLLEGIVPKELQYVLTSLSSEGYLSLEEFNSLLLAFDYTDADLNSSPQAVTAFDNLKMTASQCWCLIRNITCIVGHKVPRDECHWQLLILLLEILDIVFAPKVNEGLSIYLAYVIAEHHELLSQLYPEKKLTPKHHFLIHYPTALIKCGPPSRYWCMRFEARHNFFKKAARVTNCFKNISKTLAKRNQLAFANALISHTVFTCKPVVGPSVEKLVGSLECGQILSDSLKLSNAENVYVAKWVQVGHYAMKPKCVVVWQVTDGIPQFGLVEKVICIKDLVFLVAKKLLVNYYDEHFHAYCVDFMTNDSRIVVNVLELKDHIPLGIQCVKYEGRLLKFISPRNVIM
jgi:hypothetical protein